MNRIVRRSIARVGVALGVCFCAYLPASATRLHAQSTDSSQAPRDSARVTVLRPVSVTVTRDAPRSILELPFALTRMTPDNVRPGLRRVALGEMLLGIPGVQVQERNNPTQDPRLAIRGFGARSAFGVRGVRVIRDGIPLTLPDGQTPVDWLDLESAGSVEVVRGTAAALYGNAAGGVLSVKSREPSSAPFELSMRAWDGGGVHRIGALASGSVQQSVLGVKAPSWLASVSRTQGDGSRDYSQLENTSVFARALGAVGATRLELQTSIYDSPTAENPGAVTSVELAKDPRIPDSLNITKHARKAVNQKQFALIASRGTGALSAEASVFYGTRNLDNPQPFAIVAVDRSSYGASIRGGAKHSVLSLPLRLTAGYDMQSLSDDRYNYENCSDVLPSVPVTTRCPKQGVERGATRLDQREEVESKGAFVRYELEVPRRVFASVALRYDQVNFHVKDRFITTTNLDDSGDRTLTAYSPMAGIVWKVRPLISVYANVASAFETPTITELANQPDGNAGVNQKLLPQRTRTFEAGAQGFLFSRIRVDVAAFTARANDELVPFDVPGAVGRRAFRNAGRTSRRGLEGSASYVSSFGEAGVSYAYSRFHFVDYAVGSADYSGKPIPGVPKYQGQAYVTGRLPKGWFTTAEMSTITKVSVDDGATAFAAGWTTVGFRAGHTNRDGFASRWYSIDPMVGVDNLFDTRYASAVLVNATRGRFYEPGARRRVYAGLRLGVTRAR